MSCIFHVDLDAFYASVEQHDHQQLRGKPVIVGGADSNRGVVSACSYEARTFGVHSAMPIYQARSLCPNGFFVPVRMKRYQQVSEHIMAIFSSFAPAMQQISVDEAFLDMSGTQKIYGPAMEAAKELKSRVRSQTGLTASIGIAANKYIAKMASDRHKPDGICEVPEGSEYDFISSFSLDELWGIGKQGLNRLHKARIFTIEQLRQYALPSLQKLFGEASGIFYYRIVRGVDPGIFSSQAKSKSVGNEVTLEEDTRDAELLRSTFHQLAHHVMFRLMQKGLTGSSVGIKYKLYNFTTHSAQCTPDKPIYSAEEIFHHAWDLFTSRWDSSTPIRLVGITMYSVETRDEPLQEELFEDEYKRKRKAEETALKLKGRGRSIMKASELLHDKSSPKPKKE
ncbi:MAG: DNA polymerase IV [Spirochaetota bacterium]